MNFKNIIKNPHHLCHRKASDFAGCFGRAKARRSSEFSTENYATPQKLEAEALMALRACPPRLFLCPSGDRSLSGEICSVKPTP